MILHSDPTIQIPILFGIKILSGFSIYSWHIYNKQIFKKVEFLCTRRWRLGRRTLRLCWRTTSSTNACSMSESESIVMFFPSNFQIIIKMPNLIAFSLLRVTLFWWNLSLSLTFVFEFSFSCFYRRLSDFLTESNYLKPVKMNKIILDIFNSSSTH